MEEGSSFTEIDHCLLIHDNRHEDEGAADTELVLFFWPNHVELGHQIALLGACSWVKAFSQSFTGSPVRVFEMKRFKLAMRTIGNVNLVLTAGLHYSRKALEIQLDHVVQAFHFFHWSPENIEQRARLRIGPDLAAEETERGIVSPLRQAVINEYQNAGMFLVPMVQAFHAGLAKNFHPLQYSRLLGFYPSVGNILTSRLLAKSSTLIWSCASLDEFISGCILDKEGNILVTHLDVETTRWICNFLFVDSSRTNSDLIIYLKESKVNILIEQKREFFRAKHEFVDRSSDLGNSGFLSPPVLGSPAGHMLHGNSRGMLTSSSDVALSQTTEFTRSGGVPPPVSADDLVPMRLIFVHRQRFTLCMLASPHIQPFNAFHRLDSMAGELTALESSISRVDPPSDGPSASSAPLSARDGGSGSLGEINSALGQTSLATPSAIPVSTYSSSPASNLSSPVRPSSSSNMVPGTPPPMLNSPSHASSPVLAVSSRTVSRAMPSSPRAEPGTSVPSLRATSAHGAHYMPAASSPHTSSTNQSARNAGNTYNYLSFSEETHTQEGNVGIRRPDAERQFFESLSFVHDTFNETPQITKVVYRDHQGTMFCRKLFGKETYFQQLASGQATKFAHFEDKARELLGQEHSVFLV